MICHTWEFSAAALVNQNSDDTSLRRRKTAPSITSFYCCCFQDAQLMPMQTSFVKAVASCRTASCPEGEDVKQDAHLKCYLSFRDRLMHESYEPIRQISFPFSHDGKPSPSSKIPFKLPGPFASSTPLVFLEKRLNVVLIPPFSFHHSLQREVWLILMNDGVPERFDEDYLIIRKDLGSSTVDQL